MYNLFEERRKTGNTKQSSVTLITRTSGVQERKKGVGTYGRDHGNAGVWARSLRTGRTGKWAIR